MKVLATNKKAKHDFDILKSFVAGIKLTGQEVKSVKAGNLKLAGSFVTIFKGEPYLAYAYIPPYEHASKASLANYDPQRFRKLLLNKKEIEYIKAMRKAKRLVVIPLKAFLTHKIIKIEIALAKPLKKYDKKRRKKEREEKRKLERLKRTWSTGAV